MVWLKRVDLGSCLDNRCGLQEQFAYQGPRGIFNNICKCYKPAMSWMSCDWIQEKLEYNRARSLERHSVEHLSRVWSIVLNPSSLTLKLLM